MRNYFSLILFVSIINLTLCNEKILNCDSLSNKEDKVIISFLKNPQNFNANFFQENYKNCIDMMIYQGHFEALEFFLNEILKRGIKFKDYLNSSIDKYNLLLSNLKNKFKFKETDYQKVVPAIRWAQNNEYVFLEIKFSHRHDSPGKEY
jgi:ADP-heptose:LPS heptosyltransferase